MTGNFSGDRMEAYSRDLRGGSPVELENRIHIIVSINQTITKIVDEDEDDVWLTIFVLLILVLFPLRVN